MRLAQSPPGEKHVSRMLAEIGGVLCASTAMIERCNSGRRAPIKQADARIVRRLKQVTDRVCVDWYLVLCVQFSQSIVATASLFSRGFGLNCPIGRVCLWRC